MENVKKPKFKFNFFDITIISILILAFVAAVYINVMTEKESSAIPSAGFEYVLSVEKMDDDFLTLICVGDVIYEYESDKELGEVVFISAGDSYETNGNEDDSSSGYSDVIIRLECNGAKFKDDSGVENILANGNSMRVGSILRARNTKLVFSAECLLSEGE